MPEKTFTPEQIVAKLRQIEVLVSQGKTVPQACKEAGIVEQTFYRWRKEYGGLQVERYRLRVAIQRRTHVSTAGHSDHLKLLIFMSDISDCRVLKPVAMRALAAFLLLTGGAVAQTDSHPQFEVVSIKPSPPGGRGPFIRNSPGGRVELTTITLKEMIEIAYRILPFQISGGAAWIDSIHYEVSTKAESNPKPGEMPLMLQAMLADRFQLTLRRETKELPIYALVLAKKDGKLGPGLVETKEGGCETFDATKPLPPLPPPGQGSTHYCGDLRMGNGELRATGLPITGLLPMLSRRLERTVIDATGLTAKYDAIMEWTPDDAAGTDRTGPSIFTAIQEQLGLKLEARKGPVEVLVVERAEKPSEN